VLFAVAEFLVRLNRHHTLTHFMSKPHVGLFDLLQKIKEKWEKLLSEL